MCNFVNVPEYICSQPGCSGTRPGHAREDNPYLQLEIDGVHSLQQAVELYETSTEVVKLRDWVCPVRTCGVECNPRKRNSIRAPPKVLFIQLKRFRDYRAGAGAYLKHHVRCEDSITFGGCRYKQLARIYHRGAWRNEGHYYAICRHEHRPDEYWCYDDHVRRPAQAADDDANVARVYLCLYEQVAGLVLDAADEPDSQALARNSIHGHGGDSLSSSSRSGHVGLSSAASASAETSAPEVPVPVKKLRMLQQDLRNAVDAGNAETVARLKGAVEVAELDARNRGCLTSQSGPLARAFGNMASSMSSASAEVEEQNIPGSVADSEAPITSSSGVASGSRHDAPAEPRVQHAPLEPWEEILRARFSPADIDYSRCLAREFGARRGSQCGGVVVSDGLCKKHLKTAPSHGIVTGAIPPAKWQAFGIKDAEVAALKAGARSGVPVASLASTELAESSTSSQVLAPAMEPREATIVSLAPGSLLKRRRATRPAQEDSKR